MRVKEYLTFDETARQFGISKGTLSKWAKKGLLYPIASIDVVTRKRIKFLRRDDVRFLLRLYNRLPYYRRNSHYILPLFRQAVERNHNGRN